ncbi:type I restriction enzyme subunit R domain-containing protein [Elizabethkingia anophelis]|uniref:type I restriction enzyme subunit R domain-containing protein n=1 Tax=Elizabethkingia anophelis TaxID=1117645 RepID=UPI0038927020
MPPVGSFHSFVTHSLHSPTSAKLLTGVDAPILQTLYLDKSIKDVTLLQAICRTNRLYPSKHFGRIVDYFGIFDNTAEALQFDEKSMHSIVSNHNELKNQLPALMENALKHFEGVDRTLEGFEGLEAAQNAIKTDDLKDAFAKDFKLLTKVWESLSGLANNSSWREGNSKIAS